MGSSRKAGGGQALESRPLEGQKVPGTCDVGQGSQEEVRLRADLADAARVWSLDLVQGSCVGVVQVGGWWD